MKEIDLRKKIISALEGLYCPNCKLRNYRRGEWKDNGEQTRYFVCNNCGHIFHPEALNNDGRP